MDRSDAATRCLGRLSALREAYLGTVRELERRQKPGEGLLGLKGGPKDDPCHDRFMEDVSACLSDFAAERPDSAAVRSVLEALYDPPRREEVPLSAYWMLLAAQALTPELIPLLSAEDASAVRARFEKDYPRHQRLPVQKTILDRLRARMK